MDNGNTMWKFWLGFILFIAAVPLIPFALLGELPGESWLEHPNSTYVFFMGIVLLGSDIFLPVPSSLVAVFLGARLGLELGALAIALGLTLGTTIGYYSGWYLGYPLVRRTTSEKQRQVIHELESQFSYFALVLVRAVPVLAEASVLAAGAARFRSRPVFGSLLIANMSLALLYAGFGSISQDVSSPSLLFWGGIGVPVCGFLIIYILRHKFFVIKRGLTQAENNENIK